MQRDARKYIWDARTAAEAAAGFAADASRDDFLRDDLLQAGVERKLEIMGEALGKLRRFFPDLAENIAGLNQAVGMRNVLAHEYGTVNPIMVWDTVQLHVPDLIVVLIALERELESGQ